MDKQERKLSWNKEYENIGDGWFVIGTDQEVDWLSSISCSECGYSGA